MKLFYSGASPFVRKVMATAMAVGVVDRIEKAPTNPWESPPDLLAQNPLAKLPCLVTDDGLALFDSPVICDYLASLGGNAAFLPWSGPARWQVLKQQAIADGIMDAAIIRRNEAARPEEDARAKNIQRQRMIMSNGLAALEAAPPANQVDLGTISIACCLGYLDFRFADEPWRSSHPALDRWFTAFSQHREISETAPA